MANERLDRFTKLLKEILELDKSDLDFGIYRVMNLRKTQIEEFLTQRLPQMVQETLAPFAQGSKEEIRAQMTQIEESVAGMGMTVEALPDTAPMKQKYMTLQKSLAEGADLSALETDVYSALYSFFNRYYEDGDFISKRRYKEGVYAIPYEGEEVKLYWANQDQYYIKTSENFKDYTFVFDGITVHFRLVDATTEQNNNKENKDTKPLCTNPPYGYIKDPADKLHWIVDAEAAETVRLIFKLCINGLGPTQIAKELTKRQIENPVAHGKRNGITVPAKQDYEDPYFWRTSTVARMLSRQEYLGHTVNFKTKRKSYKQKKQLKNDPSEWQIFENTHEAIIDEETFAIVQRIREGKRRPTRMGEMHMLSGLVFCGDCGNKMYHVRCKGWDHSQEYFTCATYRKQRGGCTSHQIKTEAIEQIVLAQLQSIIRFASEREGEFTEMVMQRSQKARSTELRDKKKEYDQSKARAAKLDQIMQRLYEDNISGKISDERFAKLSETYEAEQKQLIARIAELDTFFAKDQEQAVNLKTFMQHVKRYINLDHLDAEVLRTFIKRIVIMDTMPGKKGKGIEVKIEYTIDGEYKTYPDQQDRKTA